VIAQGVVWFAVATVAFLGGGCGGTANESDMKATPSASATSESGRRTVTAKVDGRTLAGHCRGTQQEAPAVILGAATAQSICHRRH
jgi:hypothetical protein